MLRTRGKCSTFTLRKLFMTPTVLCKVGYALLPLFKKGSLIPDDM
jgi:hypothetical protein